MVRDTMDFLNKDCPKANANKLSSLQEAGKENCLRAYEKEIKENKKEWQSKQNLIHKYQVEACASDDAPRLVALQNFTRN